MRIKRYAVMAVLACVCALASGATGIELAKGYDVVENGDLLFVASDRANGITSVTQGVGGLAIDHVAIAVRDSATGRLSVVEAVPRRGVCITPIDSFMVSATPRGGSHPLVVVGRLNDRCGVGRSVANALKYVGRPYDYLFMHDDQEIYCSELVLLSYVDCAGRPVFAPIRMSFHDASGEVTQFWRDYYAKRGLRVPEGAQGSNPGQLSRDPKLTIVYRYF